MSYYLEIALRAVLALAFVSVAGLTGVVIWEQSFTGEWDIRTLTVSDDKL